ncbi:hypothetical protein K474DRAFT_1674105 [Panus rudis PR-1116 ss-1]|nr:hypothetical protein K474DRAFT_1674105 [Panus rudis PR-1116 ss-1]
MSNLGKVGTLVSRSIVAYQGEYKVGYSCEVLQPVGKSPNVCDEYGMLENFMFMPPVKLMDANQIWTATEVDSDQQVIIRVLKHVNDPPPQNGMTDPLSPYQYLLSVADPDDPRNHTMLLLRLIEHMGWMFGVFPRGDIQARYGGLDMRQVGEAVEFLVQASKSETMKDDPVPDKKRAWLEDMLDPIVDQDQL